MKQYRLFQFLRATILVTLTGTLTSYGQIPSKPDAAPPRNGSGEAAVPKADSVSGDERGNHQAGRIAGASRSGLIFRLLWFESATPNSDGKIEHLELSAGTPYGSQELGKITPLGKWNMLQDKDSNRILTCQTPLAVPAGRPFLLGFLAEATQHDNAYRVRQDGPVAERLENPERFLQDEKEYDLKNPQVQKLADELKEGNPQTEVLMRRVWEHIHAHMTYAPVRRPNTGAEVLGWGKGACGEYARVSVTVLRACGIPAREVHSVYCNPEGLNQSDHGWAEAYLPDFGWVPMHTQRAVPADSKYWFGNVNSYVIYRGLGVRHHRIFKATGVTKIGFYGMGRFASMTPAECARTSGFMVDLANDDGGEAPRLLGAVAGLPVNVHSLAYWLLAASPNEDVGRQAASLLHQTLGTTANGSNEWKTYLASSPRLARQRLEDLVRKGDGSVVVVDSTSRTGTLLGSFKKGQTITLRYVEGRWMLGTDNPTAWPERSPDDPGQLSRFYRCALRMLDARGNCSTQLVEGGTQDSPFFCTLKDDCDVWLACNDAVVGNRINNNKGTATYRVSITN